jgi:meso-butanediol dehydrogenase / (S,S)-butanediol dehydrogenase / diacetyl reductase
MQAGLLEGRLAALTGASKGLGRTIAGALVRGGARVALLARPSQELDTLASEFGDRAFAVPCDVSEANSIRAAFSQIKARFDHLDILINNAAVSYLNNIEDASDDDLHREIGTNLLGPIFCIREAIPLLRNARAGQIINVSSLAARLPFPYTTMYSTTKAALEMLSFALQGELRSTGIRVTALRLGAVKTGRGLTRSWTPEKKVRYLEAVLASGLMSLVGGWTTPKAIADALIAILTIPPEINTRIVELSGI